MVLGSGIIATTGGSNEEENMWGVGACRVG